MTFTGIFARTRSSARYAVLVSFCALAASATAQAQTPSNPLPTLTHASDVRKLTPEQAAGGYPVRIRGVITMDVPAPDFFVQDATAGIYVEGNREAAARRHVGDLVEIEGVTGPGHFAPVIREKRLRILGKGKLPKSQLHALSELANGQFDSQWVQVRGIIRATSIDRTSWRELTLALRVISEDGEFNVRVPISEERDFSSWIDSEALMEGVCGSLFNAERQLRGVLLYVPRLNFIHIEPRAEEVPISGLLRFSPTAGERRRVRVRGTVAYQQPGSAVFVLAGDRGLRVLTSQETPLNPGDLVDVLGYPAVGESAPVLSDAVVQRIGHDSPPSPLDLNLAVPWEHYDGALVSTNATLLERQLRNDSLRLVLRSGSFIFDATLKPAERAVQLLSVPLNSEVRATGVCLVSNGGLWSTPQSFRILLRSPGDIAVLRRPSWWNLRHSLWLLGIMAAVLLGVLAWVAILDRRVKEQMAVIRQKLQRGAVLEERNRIARELHDSLEQELAGIGMQLDVAFDCFEKAPESSRRAVETARDMTRHSMLEARRSVWDLRCHLLERGDLGSALARIVEPLGAGSDAKISICVTGEAVRLPGGIEMNLLRIGQEAAANAIKHARAANIRVELDYRPEKVLLSVQDDGCGFQILENPPAGHFGLQDMRERAQAMGASLELKSRPEGGSLVAVVIPVKEGARQ